MTGTLLIELDWSTGTLQRLVGLIERRGFEVVAMELAACGLARQAKLEVQAVDGRRDFDVLCRQIDKLHGMRRHETGAGALAYGHRFPLVG